MKYILTFLCAACLLLFYSSPKTIKSVKARDSTFSLRVAGIPRYYYILICGSGHKHCYGGLLGGNSGIFLDGLDKVYDINNEDGALVISIGEGQDLQSKLENKEVGYKLDSTAVIDGIKQEYYTSTYKVDSAYGVITKQDKIIVKYIK